MNYELTKLEKMVFWIDLIEIVQCELFVLEFPILHHKSVDEMFEFFQCPLEFSHKPHYHGLEHDMLFENDSSFDKRMRRQSWRS